MKRLLAWLLGYFYLPCPRCGRMFAGWEASDEDIPHPDGQPWHTLMTCRKCVVKR